MLSLVNKIAPLVGGLPSITKPAKTTSDPSEAYLAAARFRSQVNRLAFILLVLLPTTTATIFYMFIAAPRYVSEVQYLVRSVSSQRASGLDMLFRSFGLSRTVDDGYAIEKYLLSKDVVAALQEKVPLREIFSRPEADFLTRFPRFWEKDNAEYLYRYFLNRVTIREDEVKGITVISVATFRPEDSQTIAKAVVELAEGMVNRLNARAQHDTVEAAKEDVATAEKRVIEAQQKITEFRTRELLVDPGQSSLSYIELIGGLNAQLSKEMTQLRETEAVSPSSPQLAGQKARINAIQERITAERSKLFGKDTAISPKIAEFEQLSLLRDIADKSLVESMNSLDTARQEARRQHIYIEQVVEPHLADWATEPERLRGILATLVAGFAIFAVIWILSVGVGEHSQ